MKYRNDRPFSRGSKEGARFISFAAACAIASIVAGGCASFTGGSRAVDLRGMVYGFDNAPVASYCLSLDGKREVETDVTGRFSFRGVSVGAHRLSGFREGYERYDSILELDSRTDIAYLRVASADYLIGLADEALSDGDIKAAGNYVSRAEQTGSTSVLIPFYAAIVLFREGRAVECADLVDELGRKGFRDRSAERLKAAALALSVGEP